MSLSLRQNIFTLKETNVLDPLEDVVLRRAKVQDEEAPESTSWNIDFVVMRHPKLLVQN